MIPQTILDHGAWPGCWRGTGRVGRGLLVASTLLVAACAQGLSTDGDSATRAESGAAPSELTGDAIARFAINAPEGASSQVSYGERSMFVTVGPYYQSAAGERCRRVTIREPNGGSRVSAVCQMEGGWQTVLSY